MPAFPDIDALNAWLEEQCIAQWGQIQHGVLPGTIADVHATGGCMPLFDSLKAGIKQILPCLPELQLTATNRTVVRSMLRSHSSPERSTCSKVIIRKDLMDWTRQ